MIIIADKEGADSIIAMTDVVLKTNGNKSLGFVNQLLASIEKSEDYSKIKQESEPKLIKKDKLEGGKTKAVQNK